MHLARTSLKTEAMFNTSISTLGVHKFFEYLEATSNF